MLQPERLNQVILNLSTALTIRDTNELESIVDSSLEEVSKLLGADRGLLFLIDEDNLSFSVASEWQQNGDPDLKPALQGLALKDYMIWGKFGKQENCIQISNTQNIPDSYPFDSKLFRDTGCNAFIQKSLKSNNRIIGFISLLKSEAPSIWDQQNVKFLDIAGELIGQLIERIYNKKKEITPEIKKIQKEDIINYPVNQYSQILDNLQYGIAIFDTILQKFTYCNTRFRHLLGFGKDGYNFHNEIFRLFELNGYNSREFFSNNSQSVSKDFTIKNLSNVLNGTVTPLDDFNSIVMHLNDITTLVNYEKTEKTFNRQMKVINEAAIELIAHADSVSDIYQFIGETAFKFTGNSVIIVNKYFEGDGYLKTVYVRGFGFSMDLIAKLLGKHPMNKTYPLEKGSAIYNEIINLRIKEHDGGLAEIALGSIAEPIARKIEKILNVSRVLTCALFSGGELFGTISFLLRPDEDVNNYVLENFSRLISGAIDEFETHRKLVKTSRVLTDAAKIARIAWWEYDFCQKTFTVSDKIIRKISQGSPLVNFNSEITVDAETFLSQYIKVEDRAKILQLLDKANRNRKKENFAIELEFDIILQGGSSLNIYTRGVVNKGGKITGVAQDISPLKKAEKRLWESELKFRNLVEQSLDAIVVIRDNGTITEWNPRAEEITGMSAETVIGKLAWQIESALIHNPYISREHPQQPEDKLKHRFFRFFNSSETGTPQNIELSIRNNNGEIKHLSVTSFIFVANQTRFLCRISKDVTFERLKQEKEKQIEILRKTTQAKDLFLDNMSHEMRTPLSGIIGMTDILMHTRVSNQQMEMLKVVRESSDSLLELISNIHELSRLEADGIVLQQRPFRLAIMMEKVLSIFRASAIQKSIELELIDNSPANLLFTGDDFRLRQILGNLVGNGIKFTPPGGRVDAKVKIEKLDGEKAQIMFEIADTGIGIENDKIPLLFQKFTQADNSYTREYEGVGIGLSICRELIRLMGGDIGVTSEHRKGSVFWIKLTLPYTRDE